MFRLTPKFGLHRVSRTDQGRKSRTPLFEFLNPLSWISNHLVFLCWIHTLDTKNILKDPWLSEVHFFLNLKVFLKSDRVLAIVKTAILELKTFYSYC